ncbi:sporulation integral membrane protein YtvI [Bacillus solimangrovi]|uniref:Sporulation integral membrane protein YtvI n=1 Tax=Bacillus solimangrovi TaxID=1305675 RepID=A0A1E5LIK4_9BACI|nr:sporulation integral membrane protein YtvI [Bacillus solimangrovi]OEH93919.1 sporulation integral membrane protein YtvI [Bacillus solimangrovi]
MSKFFSSRFIIIIVTLAIIIGISLWVLPNAVPLIIAFITALILDPLVRLATRRLNIKRSLAVLLTFILFLCFLGASSYFIVTKVVTEVVKIGENAPVYINEISDAFSKLEANFSDASEDLPQEFVDEINNQVTVLLSDAKNVLTEYDTVKKLTGIIANIPNYLVSLVVYLIALFLFMIAIPNIKKEFYTFLTPETADKVTFMTSRLSYVISGFFKAQFLVSIIIFIVSFIGLLIIAPEVAFIMSLIIWIIDFIPIIGSIAILAPWSIFHLLTGDIALGTKLAILAAILLIIRRTVEPKVMGHHIGLSPLSTLIAMYLGLKLLGFLGFFIGPVILIAFNSAREAGIIKLNFKI